MADRRLLTDRYLRALPPAPHGQRVEVFDARLPGFGLRVTDAVDVDPARRGKAGKITFILFARFSPGAAPTRRVIGTYGAVTLEDARRTAGEWRTLIARGIDPAVIEAEVRAKAARERAARIRHSFANVAEAFVTDKLPKERSGRVAERDLRGVLRRGMGRPPGQRDHQARRAGDHQHQEAHRAADGTRAAGADQAVLQLGGRSANLWPDRVTVRPAEPARSSSVESRSRDRRLNDAEMFAFWRATGRMGYPVGPLYRMLLLTGLRLNEAAQMSWPEVHGDTIIIPASRMKGRERQGARTSGAGVGGGAGGHRIAAALKNGPYLFSLQRGQAAVDDDQPDQARPRPAHAADAQGDGPPSRRRSSRRHAAEWTNHDLRRVVRSGLSALRIPHNVAEAVLAHRPPGIVGTYDVHEYLDEKREALEAWAQHLASIVNPRLPPRSSSCGGGGDDRGRLLLLRTRNGNRSGAVVRNVWDIDADEIVLESASMDGTRHDVTLRTEIEWTASVHLRRDKVMRSLPTQMAFREPSDRPARRRRAPGETGSSGHGSSGSAITITRLTRTCWSRLTLF